VIAVTTLESQGECSNIFESPFPWILTAGLHVRFVHYKEITTRSVRSWFCMQQQLHTPKQRMAKAMQLEITDSAL